MVIVLLKVVTFVILEATVNVTVAEINSPAQSCVPALFQEMVI
jgi:hypothetical protein